MATTDNLFSAQTKGMAVSVTTTASTSAALPNAGNTILVFNEGPSNAFISVGAGAQTATLPETTGAAAVATCMVCPAGAMASFGIDGSETLNISAITRSGTAVLDVYVGQGC